MSVERIVPGLLTNYSLEESEVKQCIFCEIIQGKAPASIIYRSNREKVVSFMDLSGYPLVCPIPHLDLSQPLSDDELKIMGNAFKFATRLLPIVKGELDASGVNILMNEGKDAGQEILHPHIHVLPRSARDNRLRLPRQPRIERKELDHKAQLLRSVLAVIRNI